MSTTIALARTELTLLRRDTTAWTTAVALPFAMGALWLLGEPPIGEGVGALIVAQVVMLLVFTVHTAGVMALASRREQLVLKRWRTSQASPTSVLVGTIGVPAGLVLAQAAVLTAASVRISGEMPASFGVLALGVLAGTLTVGALTFLAAAFTRSSEHAMITTLPVIGLLMGGAVFSLLRPFEAADWPVLALPGGAATQLLRLGWDGPVGSGLDAWLSAAAPSLGATVVSTALATVAAVRWFRWEPRA